jgi:hypothetical protein
VWWDLLCVDTGVLAAFEVYHAGADILFLSLACLALAVKVPDWFGEGLQDVWAFYGEGVVDVVGGDDVRFAAFESLGDAEEANDIRVVGVEILAEWGVSVEYLFCVYAHSLENETGELTEH